MSFSPNLFLSNIKAKDGLARPARFEILLPIPTYVGEYISNSIIEKILNLPNSTITDVSEAINQAIGAKREYNLSSANPAVSRYLALQCESTELPGRTLQTADVKIYGPSFKVPYQSQYNEITFTFICTNDFYERKLFDQWLECIMPSDTNNMRYAKGAVSKYMTDIKIIQYDDSIKQIYASVLVDAFPIGVAAQPLAWSDEGFHRVAVQFAYQKYAPMFEGTYDLGAAAGALFGTATSRLAGFGVL
jgi:hypothetical protein